MFIEPNVGGVVVIDCAVSVTLNLHQQVSDDDLRLFLAEHGKDCASNLEHKARELRMANTFILTTETMSVEQMTAILSQGQSWKKVRKHQCGCTPVLHDCMWCWQSIAHLQFVVLVDWVELVRLGADRS